MSRMFAPKASGMKGSGWACGAPNRVRGCLRGRQGSAIHRRKRRFRQSARKSAGPGRSARPSRPADARRRRNRGSPGRRGIVDDLAGGVVTRGGGVVTRGVGHHDALAPAVMRRWTSTALVSPQSRLRAVGHFDSTLFVDARVGRIPAKATMSFPSPPRRIGGSRGPTAQHAKTRYVHGIGEALTIKSASTLITRCARICA